MKKIRIGRKWFFPVIMGSFTFIVDLASKEAARAYCNPFEPIAVIEGFFNLVLTYNSGAAFSILSNGDGGSAQGLKMAAIALVAVLPFIYFYWKAKPSDSLQLSALGFIWGGALGNIHDRLRWGKVVDFLDFYFGSYHWPAFNVADIGICVGAGLLVLSVYLEEPKEKPLPGKY